MLQKFMLVACLLKSIIVASLLVTASFLYLVDMVSTSPHSSNPSHAVVKADVKFHKSVTKINHKMKRVQESAVMKSSLNFKQNKHS